MSTYIAYIKPAARLLKGLRFFKVFNSIIRQIGSFDVVHLNKLYPFGVFAWYLKRFYKKPYLISEHWTGYLPAQAHSISKKERWISRRISKGASYICPVSVDLQEAMQALGLNGRYAMVPNVVNTDLFKPAPKTSATFTILHISNMLDKHKNVSGLLRALAQFAKKVPDFEVILLGDNAQRYRQLAYGLGIHNKVSFVEQVAHATVVDYFHKADVFVLYSNYENLPCVILESFACGIPVISTDVGGISEFFPKAFGRLIERDNPEALLTALWELYHHPILLKKEMHAYADENFGIINIATKFTDLYKKALL